MGIMWGVLTAVDWGRAGREAAAFDESNRNMTRDKRPVLMLSSISLTAGTKKKVHFNMEKFGNDRLVELFQQGFSLSLYTV